MHSALSYFFQTTFPAKAFLTTTFLMALILSTTGSHAQTIDNDVTLNELTWIDQKYFEKQRALIDNLGREQYGTPVRGRKIDLELLQRIIDGQHIGLYDTQEQQALGIVLGDVYIKEHNWLWREYKDKQGRSRAVCLPDTTHCLFPLSMITRRMKVTTSINIERIYHRGLSLMADVMPALPYSVPPQKPKPQENFDKKGKKIIPFL